jgi:hypothetical protein
MKSRIIVLSVITMMLLPVLPGVVAQPEPSIGNWELGIDYPKEDDSNPFVVSIGGSALINFWVANDGLFNIKVTFEYEVPWDAQFSGPESATIGPGANTSFSMMVAGIDVYSIDAMTKDAFTISANLEERSGIPAVIPENQEKTGDLEIPEISYRRSRISLGRLEWEGIRQCDGRSNSKSRQTCPKHVVRPFL